MRHMFTFANSIFMALLMSASLTARATEPMPPEKTLVESSTRGGLINLPAHGVRVSNDGKIYWSMGGTVKPLGQFSTLAMDGLKSDIEAASGDLVDQAPNEPKCMDAPITDYKVKKKDGTVVTVAQSVNCHDYLANGGETIKKLMDALSDLNKSPAVICPVMDCAAPQQNCRYDKPVYNAEGCMVSCGQLVCRDHPPRN